MKKCFTMLILALVAMTAIEARDIPKRGHVQIPEALKKSLRTATTLEEVAGISTSSRLSERTEGLNMSYSIESARQKRHGKPEVKEFVHMVTDDVHAHRVLSAPYVSEVKEKLDRIERSNLMGEPISCQDFTYTVTGQPAVCYNKLVLPDGSLYDYSHFAYAYDDMGRVISIEEIYEDEGMWDENIRYEYTYHGASDQYASRTFLEVRGDIMTPVEKIEYEYDDNGYTTCETGYGYDVENQEFYPVQKAELGYTSNGIGNKIFLYIWDASTSKWVGNTNGGNLNQTAEIDDHDRITELTTYTWKNDGWMAYWKSINTYSADGNIIAKDQMYWNGTDWNGPYVTAQGFPHYNVWQTYEYDSAGRETLMKIEQSNRDGAKILIEEKRSSYGALDNGEEECFSYPVGYDSQGAKYSSYSLTHYKPSGVLTLAQSGAFDGVSTYPYTESVYVTNENNMGLETVFYIYQEGKRLNDMRAITEYADDWDGISPQPISETLYVGDGTDEEDGWLPYSELLYEWNQDALIYYEYAYYIDGDRYAIMASEYEFDFSVAASEILRWNLVKDDDYGWNLYKEISNTTYASDEYGEWDWSRSTYDSYLYSPFESVKVDCMQDNDAVELERFDVTGKKIATPAKGLNIVRYSNGDSKKIMVK